jgi:ABC-type transporter Mla maintaining outer membrane lipid asymmetry ATPase subunit MlaF
VLTLGDGESPPQPMNDAVLQIRDVQKQYGALRPLRLRSLDVMRGATVALVGLDAAAAEIFVNLVTGSMLPDTGQVRVFGVDTSAIDDAEDWLRRLDRFGILSDRAVLLDALTAAQNLAMTFSLAVDAIPPEVRTAVEALARDVGLASDVLERKVADLSTLDRARVRLGRAVALAPDLLVMEHPTANLGGTDVQPFARDLRRLADGRGLTAVAVTADARFASAITSDVRRLQPATGDLVAETGAWDRVRRLFR